ncbi:MMPL family transporter [Mycolicibacter heraklionensis]|uniref:MMPL family transporter n=1 Tax=Mycolicibacter heraklionensis TaxID=512402 RepID=A0A9X7WKX5_9MYCO|nr:MMPL family transporter [Mycolicibacter heraklionensis]QZA09931.1 MMPL family transporter [Mycolicibacter heraklionensis]
MLHRIALLALAAPRRVLALAGLVMVAAAVFGIPVADKLSAGGFQDPGSESAQATALLTDKFGQSDQQLLILVSSPDGADSERARTVGTEIAGQLQQSPLVFNVASPWTDPPSAAARLISTDGFAGLIVANLRGGENDAQKYARTLADQVAHDRDGVSVRAGGGAMVYAQINHQNQHDLLLMESIAIPLSFAVLVWVFGGLLAAALPVALGGLAIVGSMAVLRLITLGTDVSIFAMNLTTAMGLALAIDYTLLIINRYRDELAEGAAPDRALIRTMATAGRTVLFSAITVALSMAAMVLFPMYFLKSFAYAGVATVTFVALAATTVTPAAIALLGPRLDALDLHRPIRRLLRRPAPVARPIEQGFWYRSTKFVARHAVPIGLVVVTLLVSVGVPFLGVRWGYPDDRVLPSTASAHQVGDALRERFADDSDRAVPIVVRDAHSVTPEELDRYAAELSRVPEVSSVSAPTGTFVNGERVGDPAAATGIKDDTVLLTVASTAPLFSQRSETQLDLLHQVPGPGQRPVQMAGLAQINRDSVNAITDRLPLVMGLIAAITFALLFLLTGSVVMPLKALILNILSLAAAFGALVWIFQDGHLGALGTTPTGMLVANVPVLLFCISFGLSMDYEVFLVSRIREYWLASGRTRADNDESVSLGVAHTARVITAAALIMSISFAALIAAQVSFMRMLGLGLTLAVLVDATLIRMVLVPAFMHLMGSWNWWAPGPLAWLARRFEISENGGSTGRHAAPPGLRTPHVPAHHGAHRAHRGTHEAALSTPD